MSRLTYPELIEKHFSILSSLEYSSGLFSASSKEVGTGYDKSWLRDNFYETIAFEVIGDWETVLKTSRAILKIFLKHEEKINWAIEHKPEQSYQYIHARFNPETFDEFWEDWGNKQNDAVGCMLYRIGELENHERNSMIQNEDDLRIVNKLIQYLASIQYYKDPDSGMWEEGEELHASSIGACVAGLKSVRRVFGVHIEDDLIEKGESALRKILPRESEQKFVDLSMLSLIWPYNVVTATERAEILQHTEYHLLRKRGIIRYKGDKYYNKNKDEVSEEAEWTFGLAWLAIIYEKLENFEKAKVFIDQLISVDTAKGLPELYFSNSEKFNANTPLGWSESLFIVALWELNEREEKVS